jgi:hypothetical protein
MGEADRNVADRIDGQLVGWQATFDRMRRRFGTSVAVLLVVFLGFGTIWWNWSDIRTKPGVDQLVQLIKRTIGLHSEVRFSQFTVELQKLAPSDPNPASRYWNWTGKHWEEKTPSGEIMFHDFVDKISLNGCRGDLTKKESDEGLEFFIPYKGCRDMTLRFNFRKNGWQLFGAIIDPR